METVVAFMLLALGAGWMSACFRGYLVARHCEPGVRRWIYLRSTAGLMLLFLLFLPADHLGGPWFTVCGLVLLLLLYAIGRVSEFEEKSWR